MTTAQLISVLKSGARAYVYAVRDIGSRQGLGQPVLVTPPPRPWRIQAGRDGEGRPA